MAGPAALPPKNMKPDRKVVAGGLAGAFTVLVVWGTREFAGVEMPGEVASAFTTIFGAVVAYLVPNAKAVG